MSSWDTYETSRAAAPKRSTKVTIGQTLQGLTDAYSVQGWIGEGSFGVVAKCMAVDSKQSVAVKILKYKHTFESMEAEVSILEELRILDPVRTNLVHFLERFECMGFYCLAFEMLDIDLYTFMDNRNSVPLQMSEIRPIAHQLLVALEALKGLGILHCDIKPDNVMFTDLDDQPLRVKLIDFGEAMRASEAEPGTILQPGGYRAPEVTLGLFFTEAIDVWGVGCVLAFLYLADNLFPVNCEYQMVKCMVDLLGLPSDHMLQTGEYSDDFFIEDWTSEGATWRLLTPEEYAVENEEEVKEAFYEMPSSLDDLANIHPENTAAKIEDKRAFVDLLKGMLCLNGEQRLTPRQALQYPFITMSHLQGAQPLGYQTISEELMQICPAADSSTSLSADSVCVSEVNITVQSDASKSSALIRQDSGVWSLFEDPSSFLSFGLTTPSVCRDEHGPTDYSHSFELLDLYSLADTGVNGQVENDTLVAKTPKCFSFWRIRKVFRRVAEALFCCVRPKEDH